ncbi:MAG TPA: carbohydrate ABC transporter permease [Spirochaetia bacterium]|nr:carbohydrate ABC transporter permease [Spirochaetia bacterium]HTZ52812.1 carbohydrate ABC transporter permease [Spirochaetia bacterium]
MKYQARSAAASRILGTTGKTVAYIVMIVFALMTIYPILWLGVNSFKSTPDFRLDKIGLPPKWFPINYVGAWTVGEFSTFIPNSILYTAAGTVGVLFFAIIAGFAFAKLRSRATPVLYGSFVMGILLSIQSVMVPLFIEVNQLDSLLGALFQALGIMRSTDFHLFYNTRLGMILIYIGSGLPIAIYLSTEYIRGVPTALVEAARMDGASFFAIFRHVILPIAAPIATTIAILQVPAIWNEFALINIIVSKNELKSLPLGIMRFDGTRMTDYGKIFAALVVGMAPMLLFYVIFRKQITKGVAGGALKG